MVTMMEHNIAYEAKLNQDSGNSGNPGNSGSIAGTPSRRARLQMAKSPRLLHHQRSVGHYGGDTTSDHQVSSEKKNQSSNDMLRTTVEQPRFTEQPTVVSSTTTSNANAISKQCQSSSSPNRCNLNKLRTEAFLKQLPPSNVTQPSVKNQPNNVEINPSEDNNTNNKNNEEQTSDNTVKEAKEHIQPSEGSGVQAATPLRVGFYEIERTIGRGNFAIVKLARHRITRTEVSRKRASETRELLLKSTIVRIDLRDSVSQHNFGIV